MRRSWRTRLFRFCVSSLSLPFSPPSRYRFLACGGFFGRSFHGVGHENGGRKKSLCCWQVGPAPTHSCTVEYEAISLAIAPPTQSPFTPPAPSDAKIVVSEAHPALVQIVEKLEL